MDELILSLLQDFNGRLGMFEEEIETVAEVSEQRQSDITLFVDSQGKRDYCDDNVEFRSNVKWQKTLNLSPVALAVFVARWVSMEVITSYFDYATDSDRVEALELSGISVTNSETKGYILKSKTGYFITTCDYLWEAKYMRLLLSHPVIYNHVSEKFNLSHQSFINLTSTLRCCSFPVIRMFPISYRYF